MSLNKPKILFLGSQMEVAGAQQVLLSLAQWFHRRGYSVEASFFYDKSNLAETWQSAYPFSVTSLEARRPEASRLANSLRLVGGLWRLFRQLRTGVSAVVAFTPDSNLPGLVVAWLAGVPVRIATHHGSIEGSSSLFVRLHGWLVNLGIASKLVAVSTQVRDLAVSQEKVNPDKVVVILNGIEPPRVSALEKEQRTALRAEVGASEEQLLLLVVGRLTRQKGHDLLLEAVARLDTEMGFLLALAGDGPLGGQLRKQAEQLGIAERVRFLGVRDDVDSLLLAADLFVQPSRSEGLSLALLEALWQGTPVLCTQVEGATDVLEDGVNARLVAPGHVEALSGALKELLEDTDLRLRLGRAGARHVQSRFSVDRMGQAYEELLRGHLEGEAG